MDDLFTIADAREAAAMAKKDGMARAEEHAAPGWSEIMLGLVIEVAKQKPRFTSDDVMDLADAKGVTQQTHDLRAFGPVMMRAAKMHVCRKANVAPVNSRRASLHASPRAVWDSLYFNNERDAS